MNSTSSSPPPSAILFGQEAYNTERAYIAAHAKPSKFVPGCWDSDSLAPVQSHLYFRMGMRSAKIVPTLYGYSLRSMWGFDDFAIIRGFRKDGVRYTREQIIEEARKWQAEDSSHRWVPAPTEEQDIQPVLA